MCRIPSALDAAHYVCRTGNWSVTNLALQKILYLLQMVHLGRSGGERLFTGYFEAWDYGPVEPSVYHKVKIFGGKPIQDIFRFNMIKEISDPARLETLADSCPFFLSKKAAELVAMTHSEEGAWAKHYLPGRLGQKIPDIDILQEYRQRVQA